MYASCSYSATSTPTLGQCPIYAPSPGPKNFGPGSNCPVGNPINPGTGDKLQTETDYPGNGKLHFVRYYHSSAIAATGSVGSQWQHNYDSKIYSDGSTVARVMYANGKQIVYKPGSGGWFADADNDGNIDTDITDKLAKVSGGWQLTTADDTVESYDANGKLIGIKDRSGYTQTLSYNGLGQLLSVTDTYNRSLTFAYDTQGRVSTLTDPAGSQYIYAYDSNNNLAGVTYPDGKQRTYSYNESAYTAGANLPHALTGITDENSNRFATFNYDATGRGISTEHAGGVEKYQLAYNTDSTGQQILSSAITEPLSSTYTRNFTSIQNVVKSTGQNQPAGPGTNCPAAANAISYDTNGNVTRRTDFNGNTTCYAYDTSPNTIGKGRNLETVRIEGMASGTTCPANLTTYTPAANERKITTEWHNRWRVPIAKAEPLRLTTWAWADSTDSTAPVCGVAKTSLPPWTPMAGKTPVPP
ncbi:DUF6531 domain-containing protein [Methylovulum psychrotolerans]|uniref:RHS repeat protein n=1 Tax=Methylovulum psychrotolerans TaxID=1704499 RepID=A0A1Z4C4N7_9GAMM|nr:DUF6531 domain-containing protein [Methylovulum psychrotolerans]ASF48502.1 hypothetical protein CEK71_21930 [Methylovulum psychrotolerans]